MTSFSSNRQSRSLNIWSARHYMSGYKDPHRGLWALKAAARSVPGIRVMRVPMHIPSGLAEAAPRLPLAGLFKLLSHLMIAARIFGSRDQIIIREFLTLPLLAASPLIFFSRRRLWFLCQHNIAKAAASPAHRYALSALSRAGFQFLVYESTEDWRQVVTRDQKIPEGIKCIPLPFPARQQPLETNVARPRRGRIRIGFVGAIRDEKSPEWALLALHKEIIQRDGDNRWELILGTTNKSALDRWKGKATLYFTDTYADYREALMACDILILPYDRKAYVHRTSGVLAEGVAAGCAVVAPNIPALSVQVMQPAPVGSLYDNDVDIVRAARDAAALLTSGDFERALAEHQEFRGVTGVARALQSLIAPGRRTGAIA